MAKRNPTYTVTKPSAAELRAVKPFIVDTIIRWAQGDENDEGYCAIVEEGLQKVFGRPPANGWRDSEGFNCDGLGVDGYDRDNRDQDGYDRDGYDKQGLHRDTRRTVDGYDYAGYDFAGFNKDGFNSRGWHRDGAQHILQRLTPEQRASVLKVALETYGQSLSETPASDGTD